MIDCATPVEFAMPQWFRIGCVTLGLLGSAALAAPAGAVVVSFGTPPEVYAATFLYEEWEALDLSGLTGFLDHTEQIEGADAATSSQTAGIDAVPNPSCLPPCTGLTAGATASYAGGGVALSAFAHAYANFDLVLRSGVEPDYVYSPGYASGNMLRAEANAAIYDRLTITSPVQLDLVGHLGGENAYASASDSAQYAAELGSVSFGTGKADVALTVTLVPTPIQFDSYDLTTVNRNATSQSTAPVDQGLAGSATILSPGDYLLKAQLRSEVRIGSVNNPTLAVQDMRSDFAQTATFHLIADDPSAVSSASGLLSFAPEPSSGALDAGAAAGLAWTARRRRRR